MATLKSLQDEVAEIKATVKSKNKWIWISAGAVLVIFIVLFFTVFKNYVPVPQEYKTKIETLEKENAKLDDKVHTLEFINNQQDSTIKNLDRQYQTNRPTETRIIHQYEKIPSSVRDLTKDQLRREITNF
jgi:flagellar biosynthesis/type III secretory pathway M-ring protein FliF/YscJ